MINASCDKIKIVKRPDKNLNKHGANCNNEL